MLLSRMPFLTLFLCLYLSTVLANNDAFLPVEGPNYLVAPDTTTCPDDFTIDLGFDVEIDLGDSLLLTVLSNRPLDGNELWVWSDPENLSCTNCTSSIYSPTDNTLLMLSITYDDGCIASDEIFVFVDRKDEVYVPNVFTPDFDGVNDRLSVYTGDGVKLVRSMQIFSRKGDLVFEATNFSGNDSSIGWNGKTRGNQHNAGAYVYVLEVELIDGTLEQHRGVINLIR